MNFNYKQLLNLLPTVGPAVASTIEFGERFAELIAHHSAEDQANLREARADLIAENDEGHARLQAKLEAARNR